MNDKKIYIVLTHTHSCVSMIIKLFAKSKYSHVSISLNEECSEMYSFGRKYRYFPLIGCFNKENINEGLFKNKNAVLSVYEIQVDEKQYDLINKRIKNIEQTSKGYNLIGLFCAYFKIKLNRDKYYCTEFVYDVLSYDGVDILKKDLKIFIPDDIIKNVECENIYEGKIKDYLLIRK